jgi:peptide/nickel transport system substrate-binding protein
LLLLVGIVVVVGCAPASNIGPAASSPAAQTSAGKRQIVVIARGEPYTLNRTISDAQPGAVAGIMEIAWLLNTRLGDVQERLRVVGTRLAEAAPTTDNGLWQVFPDGRMETTWKLRHDGRWHDGAPFTADDMVFTANAGRDKDIPLLRNTAYDSVTSVEAPDPYTLTITWNRPFILADAFFGDMEPLPKHLLEQSFNEDKAGFADQPYFTRDYIGTGPFKLQDWVLNSHLTLQAFDAYPLGRPRIDEIQWKFFFDPNVMIANLLAGAADMTLGRGISLQQALQAKDQWGDRGRVDFWSIGWVALFPQFINPNPAVLGNVQMRRALMHAFDRQQLADVILAGTVPIVVNYINPGQPEFQDTLPAAVKYDYDVRRAAQLVEELGYAKRADGLYYDAAGEKLWAEVRTTADDDLKDSLMFAMADQWKSFGVDAQPLHIPRQQAQDLEYRINRPAFELTRQPDDFSEASLRRILGRESALPENGYRGQNRTRYMSPELDGLIDRYLVTIPQAERMEIGRGIVRHVTENLPIMGVAYDATAMLIGSTVTGANAVDFTRNAHLWDVR